ncbi:carboxypeptidase-like regulatory domain-containing protein [Mucilaginibacter gynuensis]
MKLTILLIITACLQVTAGAFAQKISIHEKDASLSKVLKLVKDQSGLTFFYNSNLLKEGSAVSVNITNATVEEALNVILKNQPLTYSIIDNVMVISKKAAVKRYNINVKGVVTDEKAQPLPGVTIRIKGTNTVAVTDANGSFTIVVPESGSILVFSFIGYQPKEVTVSGTVQNINVALTPSSTSLNQVVVQARRNTRTESAVLDERRNASIVQDAISAQQIERTGSITTTQALQRVSGVTITDDKYVAVRGLGDRSVIGQLNGVRLASSDPDRSAIPLDLVPAALLDNITIYKTVTPDKPADAAAGIVELKTRSVPDSMVFEVVAQSGFNSNIGIGGASNSFINSNMGFFGNKISNKNLTPQFKSLSQQYPDGLGSIQQMIRQSNYSADGWKEVGRVNKIMQGFDPVLTTRYKQAPLNQLYSATYGNSFNLFKKHKLGLILGANYYSRTTDTYGGDLTQYSIYQGVVTGNPDVFSFRNIPNYTTPNNLFMGKYQTYKEYTGTETLNYGVLGGLTYRFSPMHEISMQYLGSWGGETQATNLQGRYEYTGLPGDVASTVYSLKQTYRNLNTFNLQGEHKFLKSDYSPRLSYNVASSTSAQNNPDYRFVSLADYTPNGGGWYTRQVGSSSVPTYTKHLYALTSGYVNGFGTFGIIQAEPNGRRWRNLHENNYNYKADLSVPFKLLGQKQTFKTGVNYLFRKRTFNESQLLLPGSNFTGNKQIPLYDVEGDLDRLVSNDVIGVRPLAAGTGEGAAPVGGYLYDIQKSPNNYKGHYFTNAMYAMFDLKLTDELRVAGGVRFEMTNIGSAVDTAGVFIDPALTGAGGIELTEPNSVYKTGYKPYYSLNATYTINQKMNFRTAFNTTLARPELREITNVFEFDAFQMGLVVGNPKLVNQYTQNLDFRWEWFPNSGEVIAISAFGKRIKNQLVKVFNLKTEGLAATYPEFPTIEFQNDPNTGTVWGAEFEVVKNLGMIWDPMRNFFLGSNLLLAQSNIKKSAERYLANRSMDRHTPKNSPLFEQAPYSINAWLNYNNKKWGTDLTTTFNMVGERLVQINLTGEPDLYTRPVPMLDFVFSQRINRRILFKGYFKNILNPAIKTVYAYPSNGGKWYDNEYINRSYLRGSEIMLGFTYKLF